MIHNNYTLLFLHGTFNCSLSSDSNTATTALWYGMLCVCWSTIYTRLCLWLSKCGENETMLTNHNNKFKMKKMTSRTTAIYVCVCVCMWILCIYFFIRVFHSLSQFDVCECFFFPSLLLNFFPSIKLVFPFHSIAFVSMFICFECFFLLLFIY